MIPPHFRNLFQPIGEPWPENYLHTRYVMGRGKAGLGEWLMGYDRKKKKHAPKFFSSFFKWGSTSVGHNSALKTPYPPLPYIFWKLWTCSFTWNHPIYDIPIQRRRRRDSATPVNSDFEGPKLRLHCKISYFQSLSDFSNFYAWNHIACHRYA